MITGTITGNTSNNGEKMKFVSIPNAISVVSDFKLEYKQVIWNPQEDITVFELALCLNYHGRDVNSFEEIDPRVERHFKIIHH
jgi:hypothetical protein